MKKILVTGAAGFIGFHLVNKLCSKGLNVDGIDNINDYYDTDLKKSRLDILNKFPNFNFEKIDLVNKSSILSKFKDNKYGYVIHLAAQAGVRYSIENPQAYIDSNIQGFINVLESCRKYPVSHLLYASSSSVYGGNIKQPFSESDNVDHPVSLYAATKKSNELMAHTYSHLYRIPTTGLRFFTVYGPWGRPDMAYFSFTKKILENKPIDVFNNGNQERDFTYIDDIISAIEKLIYAIPTEDSDSKDITQDVKSGSRILNLGNNKPVKLMEFIRTIEKILEKKAIINYLPMQAGDVYSTYADIDSLQKLIGFNPETTIDVGLKNFIIWYKSYYKPSLNKKS